MGLTELLKRSFPEQLQESIKCSLGNQGMQVIKLLTDYKLKAISHLYEPHYFVHIPKTAGRSILAYLREQKIPTIFLDHDLRNPKYAYPHEILGKYNSNSFCVVRNPFDRLVSAYRYLEHGKNYENDKRDFAELLMPFSNFQRFVINGLGDSDLRTRLTKQIHLKPQCDWIIDDDNDLCVPTSNILRFENLENDFFTYISFLTTPKGRLPKKNQTNGCHYTHMPLHSYV